MAYRAGDTVKHHPTGETWTLACDQDGDRVLPAGWPETLALADDCSLIEPATDDDRHEMLRLVSEISGYRSSLARRQLAALTPTEPERTSS